MEDNTQQIIHGINMSVKNIEASAAKAIRDFDLPEQVEFFLMNQVGIFKTMAEMCERTIQDNNALRTQNEKMQELSKAVQKDYHQLIKTVSEITSQKF